MNVFSRTKSLLFIIAILLISNISMLVYFLNRPPLQAKVVKKHSEMSEFFSKTVGFSSSQLSDFEKRKQLHRDSIGRYFKDLNDSKESFYKLLRQHPLDTAVYDKLADSVGQKQVRIEKAFFRHFLDVRSLCTPSQQPIYDSLFPGELRKMIAGRRKK